MKKIILSLSLISSLSYATNNYQTGKTQHFSYTKQLAEEHLLVKDAHGND
jgi:hypothetical protein